MLVLDNFETVTDADLIGAAELVATLRSEGSPVALGIGYRGAALPHGVTGITGITGIRLGPLRHDAAMELFVTEAGVKHRTDPKLGPLVTGLDGVPLAIVLLGALARTETRLDTLAAAWNAKRTDLLDRGGRPDRTSSLPVSIELSWERLSDDARAALSLAAMLPDGWPTGHPTMYLPASLAAGVIELGNRALLHDDGTRQRCLAPIRQHVLAHHPAPTAGLSELLALIGPMARRCGEIGGTEGATVVTDLTPEFTNLVDVIRACLPNEPSLAATVPGLLDFQQFTGLGDYQLGLDAIAASPSISVKAANTLALGQLYATRSDNDQARNLFNQALPLYQKIRDRYSQAVTHAWLARVTDGMERAEHCTQLDMLAGGISLQGFRESLRSISGCRGAASTDPNQLKAYGLVLIRRRSSAMTGSFAWRDAVLRRVRNSSATRPERSCAAASRALWPMVAASVGSPVAMVRDASLACM